MRTRIRNIQLFRALSPLSRPIADATHTIESISFIVTRIELESGIFGESNLLAFSYSPEAISGALRDLAPLATEFGTWETSRFLRHAFAETEYFGNIGLGRWAAGAINIAMWDAWGKTLGQPIWWILGAFRFEVPVYGSGGWLSYSIDELVAEVLDYSRRGFQAVKIRVGSPVLAEDVERLARVRETAGPHMKIMMDANQGMDVSSVLTLARQARPLEIHWFEEPISHTDYSGYEHLRREAGISLAMGEREFDTTTLRELIRRNAPDLWQSDIVRLGGVEGWRESALLANAHGLPVLPHYYKEYDVPLLCTILNAYGAESFDWIDGLVNNPIIVQSGLAHPLSRPGWDFQFKDEHLSELDSRHGHP